MIQTLIVRKYSAKILTWVVKYFKNNYIILRHKALTDSYLT